MSPSSSAALPAPGTRNSGSINPASQGAANSPNPSDNSAEVATINGNREGMTVRTQRDRPSRITSRTAPAPARNHTRTPPRHRQANIRHRIRIFITLYMVCGGSGGV